MRLFVIATACATVIALGSGAAEAQDWTGVYVGGSIGRAMQSDDASEVVEFDTNLDGTFGDTVRTATGVDAFSPGFCGGLAIGPTAAAGCTDDEDGIDIGGRVGYDRQYGRLVVGGLVDLTRSEVIDSVTAFSTTPAFYSFTREIKALGGLRGRVGYGINRVLVFGTAGVAWGRIDQAFTTSNGVNTFVPTDADAGDGSQSVWGYQAGGGVEYRVNARWSVTGEYLFTSLDNREKSAIRSQGPAPVTNPFVIVNAAGTDLQRTENFELQAVRVGLNYRF